MAQVERSSFSCILYNIQKHLQTKLLAISGSVHHVPSRKSCKTLFLLLLLVYFSIGHIAHILSVLSLQLRNV